MTFVGAGQEWEEAGEGQATMRDRKSALDLATPQQGTPQVVSVVDVRKRLCVAKHLGPQEGKRAPWQFMQ
jgi:hypothetical protein